MTPVDGGDWWSACGVNAELMGKDRRLLSAAGKAPERPEETRVRKLDSPKKRLPVPPPPPPAVAAAVAAVSATAVAVVAAEEAEVEGGAEPRGDKGVGSGVGSGGLEGVSAAGSCLVLPGSDWRGFRGYLPLREGKMRQSAWLVAQLLHGCLSMTSQRTRRRLHSLQACLARDLLFPFMLTALLAV